MELSARDEHSQCPYCGCHFRTLADRRGHDCAAGQQMRDAALDPPTTRGAVDPSRDERRWTLSFYQAKGGVRKITVVDGPCLTGNTTIEVVPAPTRGAVDDA
jgi:hypothetical protein